MSTAAHSLQRYLRTRAANSPWVIEGCGRSDFAGAVIIPALAESETIFATLNSLAQNPPELLARFLVLVVVNHCADADAADKSDNFSLLRRLVAGDGAPPTLNLAWVDAASPGRELPVKGGGVGLARKIGFDLALCRLAFADLQPVLVSLDADTLVEPTYLGAILAHFRSVRQGGAVLPFCHQPGQTPTEEAAIRHYELFLRHYVLGLALAGSPYAYHSIGSAFACRADAYTKAGGMNRRPAGEDFYFLQQLAKTSGVAPVAGTTVHPSARPSARTPFGTGRSVARLMTGDRQTARLYPRAAFEILGGWLRLAQENWQSPAETLLARAQAISPGLADYLAEQNFSMVWSRLQRQHRQKAACIGAFHGWFDALRTLRLIHHLCRTEHPRIEAEPTLLPQMYSVGPGPFISPKEQRLPLAEARGYAASAGKLQKKALT